MRSSGSSTAKYSSRPIMGAAHSTAWPRPSGWGWRTVEVVLDRPLGAPGDEDQGVAAGLDRLVDGVLDDGPVDDRQHFLWDRLRGRQEPGSKSRNRKDGFAQFHFAGWFGVRGGAF